MTESQSVQTCNHAYPTTLLAWPYWYEALGYEWSCVRGGVPRAVEDPTRCETCPNWIGQGPPLTGCRRACSL